MGGRSHGRVWVTAPARTASERTRAHGVMLSDKTQSWVRHEQSCHSSRARLDTGDSPPSSTFACTTSVLSRFSVRLAATHNISQSTRTSRRTRCLPDGARHLPRGFSGKRSLTSRRSWRGIDILTGSAARGTRRFSASVRPGWARLTCWRPATASSAAWAALEMASRRAKVPCAVAKCASAMHMRAGFCAEELTWRERGADLAVQRKTVNPQPGSSPLRGPPAAEVARKRARSRRCAS